MIGFPIKEITAATNTYTITVKKYHENKNAIAKAIKPRIYFVIVFIFVYLHPPKIINLVRFHKNNRIFITSIFNLRPLKTMFKRIWSLYYDGFSHLPRWAKIVLAIVAAKLFIMFVVFKMLLMPNYLNSQYTTDKDKSNHVLNELISKP